MPSPRRFPPRSEEAIAAGDHSRATSAMAEAEPALNSRSAKRHRASQFGGAKSISALASDRETREKYNFFSHRREQSRFELWIAINLLYYCHAAPGISLSTIVCDLRAAPTTILVCSRFVRRRVPRFCAQKNSCPMKGLSHMASRGL